MPTRAGAGEATVTAVNVVIGGARGRGRRAVEGGGLCGTRTPGFTLTNFSRRRRGARETQTRRARTGRRLVD